MFLSRVKGIFTPIKLGGGGGSTNFWTKLYVAIETNVKQDAWSNSIATATLRVDFTVCQIFNKKVV